jgi:hypothetical protein
MADAETDLLIRLAKVETSVYRSRSRFLRSILALVQVDDVATLRAEIMGMGQRFDGDFHELASKLRTISRDFDELGHQRDSAGDSSW